MLVLVGSGRALGTVWRLSTDTSLVVGRKDSPLLIEGDKSVSRVHATIITLAEDLSGVDIQDEGSKFGVYINGKQCPTRSISRLLVGDKIMFGAQDSVFHLRRYPIALCVANMRTEPPSVVDRVLSIANSLGIDIVEDIERCTYLLMPVLTITAKLIRALVFGRWLVSPEYIYSLEQLPLSFRVQSPSTEIVDDYVGSLKFLPPAQAPMPAPECPVDLSTVNWNPVRGRQCLFASRLFAFADEAQLSKYSSLIKAAGGSCVLLEDAVDWARSRSHAADGFKARCASLVANMRVLAKEAKSGDALMLKCLVLPQSPSTSGEQSDLDTTALITTTARLLHVRPISESEIGLAVIFVSSETHTNPALALPPEPALDTTSPNASSVISETGSANREGNVAAPIAESSGLLRRRRAPRISNFWAEKVAADTSGSKASAPMPSAVLEDTRASMEALSVVSPTAPTDQESGPVALEPVQARPRRRAGLDKFWANAISGSEQLPGPESGEQLGASSAIPSAPANEESDARDAHASALAGATNEGQPGMAVERMSLARPRQCQTACQAEHPTSVPNFKRFKKTVHPYQLT
ncbi:hypothetical protein GGI18_001149 [Coemansia linderi]|uniref:Uncharacterized protein n=1 Tax=Coemansia linderi TaxID=2663919 RepID=A0ACC1KKF8_9FUNG|nr:hypothetical protein GGI18_001149 [Coemansia linderi]